MLRILIHSFENRTSSELEYEMFWRIAVVSHEKRNSSLQQRIIFSSSQAQTNTLNEVESYEFLVSQTSEQSSRSVEKVEIYSKCQSKQQSWKQQKQQCSFCFQGSGQFYLLPSRSRIATFSSRLTLFVFYFFTCHSIDCILTISLESSEQSHPPLAIL